MATEQTQRDERFGRGGDEPDSPTKLKGRSWFGVLKRTVSEFKEDNLTDWAAALTYYGILALFPGLLVLVSLIGLAGAHTAQSLIDNMACSARCGPRRPTSERSRAPRTRSTRSARAGPYGSCARSRSRSRS